MVHSWNRYPQVKHRGVIDVAARHEPLPNLDASMLPHGNGRSYGDVCLNANGYLLHTRRLDRFISFNQQTGRLICESGVLLKDILDLVIPRGWFLPVTPGTRFVTVGGAIANDVHGKNHHVAGTFGHHVCQLELLRSSGERIVCSPTVHSDWFHATIGGLGLTGLIVWAELQLIPICNPFLITQSVRFSCLDAFWELNHAAVSCWPYTVAWIDCASAGRALGRGIYMVGQHAPPQTTLADYRAVNWHFPIDSPISLVNRLTLRVFNFFYYYRPLPHAQFLSHYIPYFFPLDGIKNWNRMYGRSGFFQYQCVLPTESSRLGIRDLLGCIAARNEGSFLAVLKTFGDIRSPGMLSFPRPGTTLALDFPNKGASTKRLFTELDAIVRSAGGAIYPAKDARMPSDLFKSSFPAWEHFSTFVDPLFSSSFWRRVTG